MKISSLEMNQIQKKQEDELKKLSRQHADNLEQLKKAQEKDIALRRASHSDRLFQIKTKHDRQKFDKISDHKKILDGAEKNLEKEKNFLENELQRIKNRNKEISNEEKLKFEKKMIAINADFSDSIEDARNQNDRINSKMQELTNELQRDLSLANLQAAQTLRSQRQENSNKLEAQNLKDQEKYNFQMTTNQSRVNQIQNEGEKELERLKLKYELSLINAQKANKKQLNDEKLMYNKKILETNKAFQERFQTLLKAHTQMYKNLEDKNKSNLESIKKAYENKKAIIEYAANDRFYQISTINPKVSEQEKFYVFSLSVPEHEKNNVFINVDKREVTLSLARRFSQNMKDEQGATNKVARSESFTKKFQVDNIMNPRGVVSKYENGVLSFRVQKA